MSGRIVSVEISDECKQTLPCQHDVRITYLRTLNCFEIEKICEANGLEVPDFLKEDILECRKANPQEEEEKESLPNPILMAAQRVREMLNKWLQIKSPFFMRNNYDTENWLPCRNNPPLSYHLFLLRPFHCSLNSQEPFHRDNAWNMKPDIWEDWNPVKFEFNFNQRLFSRAYFFPGWLPCLSILRVNPSNLDPHNPDWLDRLKWTYAASLLRILSCS